MDRNPRTFAATMLVMGVVGAVLSLVYLPQVESVWLLVMFMGATTALQAAPARLRDDVQTSLSMVGVFTGMLVGGIPLAISAAIGVPLGLLLRPLSRKTMRVVFNFGQFVVAAAAGGAIYEALLGSRGDISDLMSLRGMAGLGLAALVVTIANHFLVALVVRLTTGDRIGDSLHGVIGTALMLQLFYLGFSVVAAALILEVHPATLVLLVVPALIARRGLLGFQAQAEAYDSLVAAFVKVIEVKDPYTSGHAERVATLSEAVAGELGYDYETRRLVRYAAVLHDVGKVGIPSAIINKPGALDHDEREIIKRHPEVGAEMLRDITFLQPALDIVRCHHERLDGAGYPFGVPGEQLSPLVRIVTAVDAFDAMTSTRSYRRALTVEQAISELRQHVGSQFDGAAVEGLAVMVEKLAWKPTTAFASADELSDLESRRRELEDVLYPAAPGRTVIAGRDGAITGVGA